MRICFPSIAPIHCGKFQFWLNSLMMFCHSFISFGALRNILLRTSHIAQQVSSIILQTVALPTRK